MTDVQTISFLLMFLSGSSYVCCVLVEAVAPQWYLKRPMLVNVLYEISAITVLVSSGAFVVSTLSLILGGN